MFDETVFIHPLLKIIEETPIELAYCLSLINVSDRNSVTPPWVIINYPEIERKMRELDPFFGKELVIIHDKDLVEK